MNQRLKILISYARGAGSILDIAPASGYARLVPRASFNERLRADFHRVGGALHQGVIAVKKEVSLDGAWTSSHVSR